MTMEGKLERINNLLSHLHTEITALERRRTEVIEVLRKRERTPKRISMPKLASPVQIYQGAKKMFEQAKVTKKNAGIFSVGIDFLNKISESQGSATAEEVISHVALLLKRFESPSCLVAHRSRDEFVLVMLGSEAEMIALAESIRKGAERLHGPSIDVDGAPSDVVQWRTTISLGMSVAAKCEYRVESALQVAQDALGTARKKGRNRVQAA